MMLKVILQITEDAYLLRLDGDAEYVFSAGESLMHVIPPTAISATDGMLRVRNEESFYLHAWLKAITKSHQAKIAWLPLSAN